MSDDYDGPEGYFDQNQIEELLDACRAGKMPVQDLLQVLAAIVPDNTRDITVEFKSVLWAFELGDVAEQINGVKATVGGKTIGLAFSVEKGFMLEDLDEETHTLMTRAFVCVLRGHGFPAHLADDGHVCFHEGEDHDDEGNVGLRPDFRQTIEAFVSEMEEHLGPSAREPGTSRWDRWL